MNNIKRLTPRLFSSALAFLLLAATCQAQTPETPPTAAECSAARTAATSWTTLFEQKLGRVSDTEPINGLVNYGSSNGHWIYSLQWAGSGIMERAHTSFANDPALAKWNHLRQVPADILTELKDQYLSSVRSEAEAQFRKRRRQIFTSLQYLKDQIERDARTAPPAAVAPADIRAGDPECQSALNSLQAYEISFNGLYGDRANQDVASSILVHDTANGRQGFFQSFSQVQPQIAALEADKGLSMWLDLRTGVVDTLKIIKDDYLANGTYENPGTTHTLEARAATRFRTLRARLHAGIEALRTQIRRDQALARRVPAAIRPPEPIASASPAAPASPRPAAPGGLSLLGENSGGSAPLGTPASRPSAPPSYSGYDPNSINQFGRGRRGPRRATRRDPREPGASSALYASQMTFDSRIVTGSTSPHRAGWLISCTSDISRFHSEIKEVAYTFRNSSESTTGTLTDATTRRQVSTSAYNHYTVFHTGTDSSDVLIEVTFRDGSVASGRHLLRTAPTPPRPAL